MVDLCGSLLNWTSIQQLVKFHSLGGNSEVTVRKAHTSFIAGLKPREVLLVHFLVPAMATATIWLCGWGLAATCLSCTAHPWVSTAAAWDASGVHSTSWTHVHPGRGSLQGNPGAVRNGCQWIHASWASVHQWTVLTSYTFSQVLHSNNSKIHVLWDSRHFPCLCLPGPPFWIPVITSKNDLFAH